MNHLLTSARLKLPLLIAGLQSFLYRTVVMGGVLLTGRRLDEQLELIPVTSRPRGAHGGIDATRALGRSEF